ncbi:MAG: co-chaperone DjlA [Steroidobacteraceae bacterium]
MDWGGKLVGGTLGLLVAGPVGAALGVLAGHLVDDRIAKPGQSKGSSSPPGTRAKSAPARERPAFYKVEDADPGVTDEAPETLIDPVTVAADFFRLTFEAMGHIAKSDGRVSEQDIRAARSIMNDLGLDEAQVNAAIGHFNRGKQADYDLTQAVLGLRRVCVGRPDLLRTFLEIEMRTAIGGSDLRGPARPLLLRVAALIGVSGLEFARLETVLRIRHRARGNRGEAADWNRPGARASRERARDEAQQERRAAPPPSRMTLPEAYEVLGVSAKAGDPEVTKAYRRQLSRHHPDKLKANGLPESMLGHAKQRTQQIIEAWEVIREQRNL